MTWTSPVAERDMGDMGSINGSGRFPGGGNGNLLQYSCLENSTDRGDCQAIDHRVANSQRLLSTHTYVTSVQFSSVTQSCPTLCDPMNHSMPGLPVQHHLPEFTQTHIHQVSDTIQPSHPPSSTSPAPNPSQHQSLFQ